MYKRMLIPLDGSEIAETVLPYAIEIAGRLGLEMTFLYVCNSQESKSLTVYQAYVDHIAEMIASQVIEIREKAGIQKQDQSVKAEGEVVMGHPAEEILRCADVKEVEIILMATHGHSGIRRWAMGSVADKVLRSSTVPVWLVRAGTSERLINDEGLVRKIIVSLDGSELAEYILNYVETLVEQWNAELIDIVLLTVGEPSGLTSILADRYLAGLAIRLKEASLKVSSVVLEGNPADEIINYANKNPYCLIAIATHGRSGISRWAYGSITEKILSGASSPVFLVRPPSADGIPLVQTFVSTVKSLPPL